MLDKVYFQQEDTTCVVDFREGSIRVLPQEEDLHLQPQDWLLLEGVAELRHSTLRYPEIGRLLWNDVQYVDRRKAIQNAVKRINNAFRKCCGLRVLEFFKTGYRIPPEICMEFQDGVHQAEMPHVLTWQETVFEDESGVLHREQEIERYQKLLSGPKTALLLSGFGGVGKTALARVLYHRLAPEFEAVGWVEYHGDLRQSILASFVLCNDIPGEEDRWNALVKLLRGDKRRKLLVIDNVDLDVQQGQFPQEDRWLREASGWQNTTVVLTSRCEELRGYRTCPVGPLGSRQDPEPCMDLFCHYCGRPLEEDQKGAVRQLLELADYHTYTIELLARSACYEDDLNRYAEKIRSRGFGAPTLQVETGRSDRRATPAEQLRLLFDPESRTPKERKILWDFSILPANMGIPAAMTESLLGYTPNDLDGLCREGWLRFRTGEGFSLHSLVKEVIHFDLEEGKAPAGTGSTLIRHILDGTFLTGEEPQNTVLWKLSLAENAAGYLTFAAPEEKADFFSQLGLLEFHFGRRLLTAVRYLEQAVRALDEAEELRHDAWQADRRENWGRMTRDRDFVPPETGAMAQQKALLLRRAQILYSLGYLRSTTRQYRKEAARDLSDARWYLTLRYGEDEGKGLREGSELMAAVEDHLGYVLTDDPATYGAARGSLLYALDVRDRLRKERPSLKAERDYACTCDNLGALLLRQGDDRAEQYLTEAYEIRCRAAEQEPEARTEAAWTALNLGRLYQKREQLPEAEKYLRQAMELYRTLERERPGKQPEDLALANLILADLLRRQPEGREEADALTREAMALWEQRGPDHDCFFAEEIQQALRSTLS